MIRPYLELPRTVYVLALGSFINRAGAFFIVFLTIYLQDHLHLGERFATRTMGIFGLGAIVAALVGGHLADWLGRKRIMMVSLFGGAAVLCAFTTLTLSWQLQAAVFVFGFLGEMYRPASSAMVSDVTTTAQRPTAFALLYFSVNLGFAVGPVIGGEVVERFSFRAIFFADAATSAAYAVIILLAIRETIHLARAQAVQAPGSAASSDAQSGTAAAARNPAPRVDIGWRQALARLGRDRVFLVFCLATLCISMCYMQHLSTLPLFAREHGIGVKTYGRLIALNGTLIVLLQLPLTTMLRRFDRGRMIALSAVVVGAGFGLTAFAQKPTEFAGTIVIWTIGELMQLPFLSSVASDLAPADMRGRYMGVFGLCFSSANMIGAPIGGEILARFGGGYIWGGCFVLGLMSGALFLLIRRHLSIREATRPIVASP
ncbi:MAG: MFS transporter [Phycisphaerae bacterium]|nr:MAG: MFS transporter [Planctomycetia bacterium]RIK70521.1 MAG: hypothetical protein DCC66_04340 [Planctomycetota bacterium]GJQ26191.1 MAG: MFS transporter [Phycisphaerae bacterium]